MFYQRLYQVFLRLGILHRRVTGTGCLLILGTRYLNLLQIYFVLIPNLIPKTPILLVKLFLTPTLASTFLTIAFLILFFFCSGFTNVSPSSFSARLPQLPAEPTYIPLEQFIPRDVRPFHFYGCVQFASISRFVSKK